MNGNAQEKEDTFQVVNLKVGGSRVVSCVGEDIADAVEIELQSRGDVIRNAVQTPYVEFDEGKPSLTEDDRQVVPLDNFKFSFFIPDFSSLVFELKASLDESRGGRVTLLSKTRNIALSKDDALTIFDFIQAKYDKYKQLENEWFASFESQLSEADKAEMHVEFPN